MSNFHSTPPSPQALLAGIDAVAKAMGRNCAMEMYLAMARADVPAAPPVAAEEVTLRDILAGQALTALVGNHWTMKVLNKVSDEKAEQFGSTIAAAAYELADAMLAARGAA